MDNITAAYNLIRCLDLTSLNNDDTEYKIADLCHKASCEYGNVAAICIYPKFINIAKKELANNAIKIATVINFPAGKNNQQILEQEISTAINYGADELDIVFPYTEFLNKNYSACEEYVKNAKKLCGKKHTFKLIIESGELKNANKIALATKIGIENGADFIKTSTGKTPTSATPEAANIIMETIKKYKNKTGFKASGGIRTLEDAKQYMVLAAAIMGGKWISSQNFRIGASSLLDDLINTIKRGY